MASFNKVILLGNLTRDPEIRVTPGGMAICKFSLAVNRTFTRADKSVGEEVTYVDLDSFGKQAETIARYCTKGKPLLVEGRLRLDQWEKDGEKRSRLVVVVENFQFVGGRDQNQAAAESQSGYDDSVPPQRSGGYSRQDGGGDFQRSAPPRQAPPPPKASSGEADIDDDVPF